GMVATHDLQLAKLAEEYPDRLANFHFDIQVQEGEMLFDYKLKPGECTIFNASLLLKNIGIDVSGSVDYRFITRASSRFESRSLMASRLSKSFLPCANAISTLAKPRLLMNMRSVTMVKPRSSAFVFSFLSSRLVSSSCRSRLASWL